MPSLVSPTYGTSSSIQSSDRVPFQSRSQVSPGIRPINCSKYRPPIHQEFIPPSFTRYRQPIHPYQHGYGSSRPSQMQNITKPMRPSVPYRGNVQNPNYDIHRSSLIPVQNQPRFNPAMNPRWHPNPPPFNSNRQCHSRPSHVGDMIRHPSRGSEAIASANLFPSNINPDSCSSNLVQYGATLKPSVHVQTLDQMLQNTNSAQILDNKYNSCEEYDFFADPFMDNVLLTHVEILESLTQLDKNKVGSSPSSVSTPSRTTSGQLKDSGKAEAVPTSRIRIELPNSEINESIQAIENRIVPVKSDNFIGSSCIPEQDPLPLVDAGATKQKNSIGNSEVGGNEVVSSKNGKGGVFNGVHNLHLNIMNMKEFKEFWSVLNSDNS